MQRILEWLSDKSQPLFVLILVALATEVFGLKEGRPPKHALLELFVKILLGIGAIIAVPHFFDDAKWSTAAGFTIGLAGSQLLQAAQEIAKDPIALLQKWKGK